ncbi:MAG: DUF2149 domain-containing protein [Lachnospiraceae bacterium]
MSRVKRRRRNHFNDGEDLNPMSYVSNLSDVMLILAVGIMLALILHWNVQIDAESSVQAENTQDSTPAISFSDEDLQNQEELPENMEHMGEVYYDPVNKTYYILQDGADGEQTDESTGR